jgi:DNA modification methylase
MSVRILLGDVRERLAELPADHFDCVVTSPPYWGLRDYGIAGQVGLEASLGEHLSLMVDVFRHVRRVLKPSGTLWVNYGDCYATSPNGRSAAETKAAGGDDRTFRDKPMSTVGPIYERGHSTSRGPRGDDSAPRTATMPDGRVVAGGTLKPKDLCMVPNRLAIALQDDGWWVRSEIIWAKPNAMPDSSGRFRPATAHEKFFLLTKSDAPEFWPARDTGEISSAPDLSEQCLMPTSGKLGHRWIGLGHYYNAEAVRIDRVTADDGKMPDGWNTGPGGHGSLHPAGREKGKRSDKQRGHSRRHEGFNERWDQMPRAEQQSNGRLLRNYERAPLPVWEIATRSFTDAHFATFCAELVERCLDAGCPPGGRVLDPFGGSGTTALVADGLGLDCTLIEISPAYAEMARRRIAGAQGMFADVEIIGTAREAAE